MLLILDKILYINVIYFITLKLLLPPVGCSPDNRMYSAVSTVYSFIWARLSNKECVMQCLQSPAVTLILTGMTNDLQLP